MTKPADGFIPRGLDPEVAAILAQFALGLEELVNFGSVLIGWDLEREDNSDEHLPALLFLRNFLEEIDAISIMVRHGAIDPCKNLTRTALENLFSLEYMLETDSTNRALAFLVWNTVTNNKLLRKADGKSEAYKDLLAKYRKDKLLKNTSPLQLPIADAMILTGERLLGLPKFVSVKAEYDQVAAKKSNPPWYMLFGGPSSMADLAGRVGLPAIYEVLYRGWSQSIHGNDMIQGKIADADGLAHITQIRNPKEAQFITQHCFNLAILSFRTYVQQRLPEKQNEFNNWYLSIRDFNLKLSRPNLLNVI
jgi:hypothetical protein